MMNPYTNDQIAGIFDELINCLTILGENDYKISSYKNATFAIRNANFQLSSASESQIKSIRGIGENTASYILQIINQNHFAPLQEALELIPESVLEMQTIRGLGAKKISLLWKELNINSIEQLKQIALTGDLEKVKGFGKKTVQNLIQSILFIEENRTKKLYAEIEEYALELLAILKEKYVNCDWCFVGDFAKQNDIISNLEILTTCDIDELAEDAYLSNKNPSVFENILSYVKDYFNISIITTSNVEFNDYANELNNKGINFKINTPIFQCESNYFQNIEPNSENIIKLHDIKGLIHCHSTYSDGQNTLEEILWACQKKGLEYLVISDHSQSATYANGLTIDRIKKQHEEIDLLNQKYPEFKIYKSIECDILQNGSLDYNDQTLATFDIVIASVHSGLNMSKNEATQRLLTAILHPKVDILGHSTGRLLLKREGYEFDLEEIVNACLKNNVAMELNANPRRLDVDWRWLPYILSQGVKTSINPDAHTLSGIEDLKYGVLVAQKGGVTPQNNLSSLDRKSFEEYFRINS